MTERESMPCDVVIVGGGPAGLSAAIRLKQINEELEVVVLEKGSEIGAHILSGAVVDPKALDELFPDWRDMDCPMAETPVTDNWHWVLGKTSKFSMPHLAMPPFPPKPFPFASHWESGKALRRPLERRSI